MSDRCPICAGALSAESSSCPSCGHELIERAPTGAFVSRYDEADLTTDSLLAAPAVYRKLLDTEETTNPLWTESDDPLALPLPARDRPREFWPTAILASVIALIAVFGLTRLFGADAAEPVEVLGITAQGSTIATTVTTIPATTTTVAPTTTTTVAPTTTTLPPLTVIASGP
ncbi:MAG: hypothetical protein HKM97_03865, partial [Acidimicrobiia bacterium]|nr:hypothetical protein [Acidimicrobiia bacterium]